MKASRRCSLCLGLLAAPLAGCSKPCASNKRADPKEPLRPGLAPIGSLPAGAIQCLDTHPSGTYDGSFVVYPKLDPNAGDAETSRALAAQGWISVPLSAKVKKEDFDEAVAATSWAPTCTTA